MSEDNLIKLLIAVSAAFFGWVLAQFTSAAKTWLQRRKIKKLLLEELGDINIEITRLLIFYSRQLQIFGANGIGNSSSTGISNFIFTSNYKDALLSLNQQQRISYQLVHALVDSVNNGLSELKEMTVEIQNEHFANGISAKIAKAREGWGEKVKAEYQHCASLQWQVKFHLTHSKCPDLSPYTNHHENYVQYLQSVQAEAERVIETGKTIDIKTFNTLYNPETFAKSAAT